MPCNDAGPSYEETCRDHNDRTIMTRLACDRCRDIESRGMPIPGWVGDWWLRHKRYDEERVRAEKKAARAAEVRKQALSKLTDEEIAELGV